MRKYLKFIFGLSFFLLLISPRSATASCQNASSNNAAINLVNQYRISQGLCPLLESKTLNYTASLKACDIYSRRYWSHTTPEGLTFSQFMYKNGANFRHLGENLASNYNTDQEALSALINSATHRQNLLSPYTHIGIARCGNITAQHFGQI